MEPNTLTKLLAERPVPFDRIVSLVADAANMANPQDFWAILNLARSDEDYCFEAEISAVAALPAWGKHGIEEIKKLVPKL